MTNEEAMREYRGAYLKKLRGAVLRGGEELCFDTISI
jgi:hypothetical protein